jgi:hypothetical protein
MPEDLQQLPLRPLSIEITGPTGVDRLGSPGEASSRQSVGRCLELETGGSSVNGSEALPQ